MSFNIQFAARSVYSARQKLAQAYAPALVKALVEKALDAMPLPAPAQRSPDGDSAKASPGSASAGSAAGGGAPAAPVFFGVFVEAWGHISDLGDMSTTSIERFVVRPLFD